MPTATRCPAIVPVTPLPVNDLKSATSGSARPRSVAAATMAAASGCSLARSRPALETRAGRLVEPSASDHRDHARLAFGQRAGLVDDQRVDRLQPLQRFGILDQHAGHGAFADSDHDGHRCGETERARAGDDQHGDRRDQRISESRRRAPDHPGDEGDDRRGDDRGHEPGRDDIGKALDRRTAALRLRNHLDDTRQHRLGADLFGAHDQRSRCR